MARRRAVTLRNAVYRIVTAGVTILYKSGDFGCAANGGGKGGHLTNDGQARLGRM